MTFTCDTFDNGSKSCNLYSHVAMNAICWFVFLSMRIDSYQSISWKFVIVPNQIETCRKEKIKFFEQNSHCFSLTFAIISFNFCYHLPICYALLYVYIYICNNFNCLIRAMWWLVNCFVCPMDFPTFKWGKSKITRAFSLVLILCRGIINLFDLHLQRCVLSIRLHRSFLCSNSCWGILVTNLIQFNHDNSTFRAWYDRHHLPIRNACVLCSK